MPKIALEPAMDPAPRRLVVTVHGIRTFGSWQERLEVLLRAADPGARFQHYKYGYFSCVAFMLPPLRWWVTRRFRRALTEACGSGAWERIDVVAHSFGTHLVAWGLHGIPRAARPRIHTLILAGSVLKPGFRWQELTADCVGRVVNDCGTEDGVLVLNQAVVLFTGMAGRVGFVGMSHERFRNRFFPHGHSGYFLEGGRPSDAFMRRWWLPILLADDPPAAPEDPRDASPLQGLVAFALNNAEPVKLALALAPFVFLTLLFFGLYREADRQGTEARARLVDLQLANAARLGDEEDHASELVWLAAALETGDAAGERDQRVRFATTLRALPRLSALLFLENWRPRQAVFSPDGAHLALGGGTLDEQGARIFDVATGAEVTPLLGHDNTVNSIAFSPDGTMVVTASDDHSARVWDAQSGARLATLAHDAQLTQVSFSPDGARLLTVGRASVADGLCRARVWDVASGTASAALQHGRDGLYACEIEDAAFAPDGHKVATIASDGTTQVWDTVSGTARGPPLASGADPGLIGARPCVAFSADGARLVTSSGASLCVWDVGSGALLAGPWTLEPCSAVRFDGEDSVLALDGYGGAHAFSVRWNAPRGEPLVPAGAQMRSLSLSEPREERGPRLALACTDGTARVWDVWAGTALTPPLRHERAIEWTCLSRDGSRVATVDVAGVVRVWEVTCGAQRVLEHGDRFAAPVVSSACFSPDGRRVLTVARDWDVARVFDAASGAALLELAHADALESACFDRDGSRIVTASIDGSARVWDALDGAPLGPPLEHPAPVTSAVFSPDGERIVTACDDGAARVWSARDGRALLAPIEHAAPLVAALFGPDGRTLLVAGGASARLYDVRTGERVTGGPRQDEIGLSAAALSPDGRVIASGSADGVVRLWDAASGEPLTPPLVHSEGARFMNLSQRVTCCAFSRDGSLLATASYAGTTRVWDVASGALAAPPLAGGDWHAAFSPDGRWIATAGTNGVARVWDVASGAPLTPPLRHAQGVTCVAFDARGERLVSTSLDGSARLWDLTPDERPAELLRVLAEVAACRRIDASGGLVDLTEAELEQRWRARHAAAR